MAVIVRYSRLVQRVELASLSEFVAALAQRSVTAVAMQVVNEVRPRTETDGAVVVGRHRWIDLSAYDEGTVLALRLSDDDAADPDAIERTLKAAGATVRRRSANLT
jgi:hypothetical protein